MILKRKNTHTIQNMLSLYLNYLEISYLNETWYNIPMSRDSKFFFKVSNLKEREIDYEKVKRYISTIHDADTSNSEDIMHFEKPYLRIKMRPDVVSYEKIQNIPFNDDHFVVCNKKAVFEDE